MFDVSVFVAGVEVVDDHKFDDSGRQSSVTSLLKLSMVAKLMLIEVDEIKLIDFLVQA